MMWCGKCYIVNFPPEPELSEEPRDYFTEGLRKFVAAGQQVDFAAPPKYADISSCKPCLYLHGEVCTVAPQVWGPGGGWSYPPAVYRCKDYIATIDMASRVAMWRAQEG